jgi:diguanylate cyclase (GGDEF)-like protein
MVAWMRTPKWWANDTSGRETAPVVSSSGQRHGKRDFRRIIGRRIDHRDPGGDSNGRIAMQASLAEKPLDSSRRTRSGSVNLSTLFAVSTMVLVTLIGVMLSRIIFSEWRIYHATGDGLWAVEAADRGMVAVETIVYERGPTNGMLGDDDPPDPVFGERLRDARAASDAALQDLIDKLAGKTTAPDRDQLKAVYAASTLLAMARQQADRIAALPRRERSTALVTGVVNQMYEVIPPIMQVITSLSKEAAGLDPQFGDAIIGARYAVELRDYAGRLGSQFTAALTQQRPLDAAEHWSIDILSGRVQQLRDLIHLYGDSQKTSPRILDAVWTMEERYFHSDLAFVESVERIGNQPPFAGLSTGAFAARYVPDMESITRLRSVMMQAAIGKARVRHADAGDTLIAAFAMGTLAFAVVALLFGVIRWRVVTPLLRVTDIIVGIAHGDLDMDVPVAARSDEIGDMLRAVANLKADSVAKRRMEDERKDMIRELRRLSSTDFLTGLLNRRSFADIARPLIASANCHGQPVSLVMFDIDHFKLVNDQHGHEAGDRVLVEIATIARREFRASDLVSRHGGEEFVALLSPADLATALMVAERVRAAIAAVPMRMPDDNLLHVTVSFGCATAEGGTDLHQLLRLADQALYAAKAQGRNRVMSQSFGNGDPLSHLRGTPSVSAVE